MAEAKEAAPKKAPAPKAKKLAISDGADRTLQRCYERQGHSGKWSKSWFESQSLESLREVVGVDKHTFDQVTSALRDA